MSETATVTATLTSDAANARTMDVAVYPKSIKLTANSKSVRIYSNEKRFYDLMLYLTEEKDSW